jgi:hypothetical protein
MGDAARYISHLPGVEVEGAPLGVIQRVAAKLKPDLVFVAAAMKTVLFLFEIINVDAEFFAILKYRRARAAFAGHAGKIVKGA